MVKAGTSVKGAHFGGRAERCVGGRLWAGAGPSGAGPSGAGPGGGQGRAERPIGRAMGRGQWEGAGPGVGRDGRSRVWAGSGKGRGRAGCGRAVRRDRAELGCT